MQHRSRPRPPRVTHGSALLGAAGLWLGFAATATLALLLGTRLATLAAGSGRARVDGLVELGVLAAGVVVLGWLALSCAVAAGCLTVRGAGGGWSRGEAWVHRWAPVAVRRAVVLAVGAGLGLSAATGASAADIAAPDPSAPGVSLTSTGAPQAGDAADLGWVPTAQRAASTTSTTPADRASTSQPSAATARPAADATPGATGNLGTRDAEGSTARPGAAASGTDTSAPTHVAHEPTQRATASTTPAPGAAPPGTPADAHRAARATVTVAAGDTLWAIAARYLPAGADDQQIATAWPVWYATNATTIGDDPDVILPGQTLDVPTDLQEAQS